MEVPVLVAKVRDESHESSLTGDRYQRVSSVAVYLDSHVYQLSGILHVHLPEWLRRQRIGPDEILERHGMQRYDDFILF